MIHADLVAP